MRAWERYEQDLAARRDGEELIPRQEYYNALRDELHDELVREGRSDLLDTLMSQLKSGEIKDLYLLDFAALMACSEMIVKEQPLRDTTAYVPYARSPKGGRLAWGSMRPNGPYRMRVTPEIVAALSELQQVSQQLHDRPEDAVDPPADPALQRQIDQLQFLNHHLDQQNAALIAERDLLRKQLADMQEGYIADQVRFAAENRRRKLEAELEREFALKKAEATLQFRRQYEAELKELESRRAAADQAAIDRLSSVTEEYQAIRRDMQGQMKALEERIARQAEGWQQSLHRSESRMLAGSYVALYALCAGSFPQLLASAQDSPLLPDLMQFHSDLRARLTQLEQAMLRLGLQVLRPQPGTPFDPALHCPAGAVTASVPADGTPITGFTAPGVKQLRTGEKPFEVLIRAEVTFE